MMMIPNSRRIDDATVVILDTAATLFVQKEASVTEIAEPGGDVTFTITAQNVSQVDDITVNEVIDSIFGDVSDSCQPTLPALLEPERTVTCTFSRFIDGTVGSIHRNVATVNGIDDDENPVTGSDDAEVEILDVPSSINVIKTAGTTTLPEPGDDVTFIVTVENTSPEDTVSIERVVDNLFGDISNHCSIDDQPIAADAWPVDLAPTDVISCTFTEFVGGATDSTHENVVTATGTDDDGQPVSDSDNATIEITDLQPTITVDKSAQPAVVPESGGLVAFTVEVVNNSLAETVTVESLIDSIYGDLNGVGTCSVPQTIAPNALYRCTFSDAVIGNVGENHINIVTAEATDDEGNETSDSDEATVDFSDVIPTIEVVKNAAPSTVLTTGGLVTFTVTVINSGQETVTLTSLIDDQFGDLDGVGSCATPQTIDIGGSYTCRFAETLAGTTGTPHVNIVEAEVTDNDGNRATDTDSATVTFDTLLPLLDVFKEAELLVDTFDNPDDAGKITPGDTLRYEIEVSNRGDGVAEGVILEDVPDAKTALIVGSVTTTKGTIREGNEEGDTKVVVDIGTVAPNGEETIRITFDVLIDPDTASTILSNQATVTRDSTDPSGTSSSPSDDPSTPKEDDPTLTEVVQIPTSLPDEEEPSVPQTFGVYLPVVLR